MRALVTREWNASHDADEVISKLDDLIGYGFRETLPMATDSGASLSVHFPSRLYRYMAMEAMRKREPLAAIAVPNTVSIRVATDRIDGPDIEKVIVERDGKTVRPISGALRPVVKRTALGATAVVHEGLLNYSCAAFLPGATVTVIGIPATGNNIEFTITSDQLERFTGHELPAKAEPPADPRSSATQAVPSLGANGEAATPQLSCVRPSSVGVLDWDRMSPAQRAAVCVPGTPVSAPTEGCSRPKDVGMLEWNQMDAAQQAAACRAARDR